MSSIASTPQPPYYAVIFTNLRTDSDTGYDAVSERMVTLAQQQEGFLGVESVREDLGITVSYWDSLEAIAGWKRNAEHQQAQANGRNLWYRHYWIRICRVEREYSFTRD